MSRKFLIVGAGFFGSVCARELTEAGHECLIVEKRNHIGGNCFTRYWEEAGCNQHVYGPHIFHTNSPEIWAYVNQFTEFNHFVNRPRVFYRGNIYSFPLNLLTLYQVFGVKTPAEAEEKLASVREPIEKPGNLEDWCLSEVGREIYEIFIKGYTIKQWQKDPRELPASIIRRLPIRLTYNDNYYTDRYQGIPIGGYTSIFEKLLKDLRVELKVDFLKNRDDWLKKFDHIIYTGPVDAFFDYSEGVLEYRSLRFENELLNQRDFQGNAMINYTDEDVPFTRIAEHKHFDMNLSKSKTLITREFSQTWKPGLTEYYPVNTTPNNNIFKRYTNLIAKSGLPVTFGGRLGQYRYFDMHQVIAAALSTVKELLSK